MAIISARDFPSQLTGVKRHRCGNDELLDTYGGSNRPAGNNGSTNNRRNGSAYSRNGRREAA